MKARRIADGIFWVGAVDWDRRLFDALVPLPEGTSYNAYLIQGDTASALIDTVDPAFLPVLQARLADLGLERLDYVVANHAEQDHSGSLPWVMERFPEARLVCSPRARKMLPELLPLPADRFLEVEEGTTLDLGGKTLRFIPFPWVHWPETMLTYLPEAETLFPCDLFGSHWATSSPSGADAAHLAHTAKLYFAEIMMPLAAQIAKSMPKLEGLPLARIAPSHGPLIDDPRAMLAAYADWLSDRVDNRVVIPYVSMHDSTRRMVDHLIDALAERGVTSTRYNLETPDVGALALSLVDAATVVFAAPTVLGAVHPNVLYAVSLTNLLKPKTRQIGVIGSFGWGSKAAEQVAAALPNLKDATFLPAVLARGRPDAAALTAIEGLAQTIAERHAAIAAR